MGGHSIRENTLSKPGFHLKDAWALGYHSQRLPCSSKTAEVPADAFRYTGGMQTAIYFMTEL